MPSAARFNRSSSRTLRIVRALRQVVVCRVGGSEYVKILRIKRGRIQLVSANERFKPRDIDDDIDDFELIGVVVGRSGYPAISHARAIDK